MAGMFDIKMLGDKELERAFGELPEKSQTNVIRTANRRSADRLKTAVLLNLSGRVVEERTGRYVAAMEAQRIKTRVQKGNAVVATFDMPERAALGIDAKDKGYYPAILEYGSPKLAARAPIRKAVNDNLDRELAILGKDIAKGIANQWKRLSR